MRTFGKTKFAVLYVLLAAVLAFGTLGVLTMRPVRAFQADSDTVTVHKGVDLATFRDGRYMFRQPWSEAKGANQSVLDNELYNFFDGEKADFSKGWIYESGEGLATASIPLARGMSGNFSLVGTSLQEVEFFDPQNNGWARNNRDYNQISFVFTDTADASNTMVLDIAQSSYWWATVTLSYGGKTVSTRDNTQVGSGSGDTGNGGYCPSYSFSDGHYGSEIVKPIMLELDIAGQTLTYDKWGIAENLTSNDPYYQENKKFHFDGATEDVNDHLPAITGFETYDVDMIFSRTDTDVYKAYAKEEPAGSGNWVFDYEGNNAYKTQKFMIFEINGTRLNVDSLGDEVDPEINQIPDVKAQVGQECYLPLYVRATDNVDGNLLDARYFVTGPDGGDVEVTSDNYFTPTAAGEYTVICSATDTAGNSARETFTIEAVEGPLWYKNADLTTFRGGRYKDFLPVIDSDGSGYGLAGNTATSTYYSGGLVNPNSGLYLETAGYDQKILLGDQFSGNFSMIGAGIQENDIINGDAGSLN